MAPSKNMEREARDRLRRYHARQTVHAFQVRRRRRDNVIAVVGIVVIAALATLTQLYYFSAGPGHSVSSATPSATPSPAAGKDVGDIPNKSLAQNRTWTGTLTLNTAALTISLNGKAAPQAVAAFVSAVKAGYFPKKTCHRLVKSANSGLIQCGSSDGTGGGDQNYKFGPIENAPANQIYPAGTIAMARQGNNAYSQGHQFFIVFTPTTLPNDSAGGYTVFGSVTGGLDKLTSSITNAGVAAGSASSTDGAPAIPTTITSVTVK